MLHRRYWHLPNVFQRQGRSLLSFLTPVYVAHISPPYVAVPPFVWKTIDTAKVKVWLNMRFGVPEITGSMFKRIMSSVGVTITPWHPKRAYFIGVIMPISGHPFDSSRSEAQNRQYLGKSEA